MYQIQSSHGYYTQHSIGSREGNGADVSTPCAVMYGDFYLSRVHFVSSVSVYDIPAFNLPQFTTTFTINKRYFNRGGILHIAL
jgi:hypothetical protein